MDNAQIDAIIDKHNGEARALILILMDIQHHNRWLPKEALLRVSERLDVPLSRIQQIASFYKTFSLVPGGKHEIHVCTGTSCHLRGSQEVLDSIEELVGIRPGEISVDSKYSLETVNCIGCCSLGPVLEVDGKQHGRMVAEKTAAVLKEVD